MPKGYDTLPTMNPQQMQIFNQLLQSMQGMGGIQNNPLYQSGADYWQSLLRGDDEAFADFEAPFKRQFNEETVPGLAERFSNIGSGSQNSSAFGQALSSAGSSLTENLAALRGGLRNQAAQQALGYAQQPYSNMMDALGMQTMAYSQKPQKQMPFWQQLLVGMAPGVGQGGAAWAGNKWGGRK